MADPPYSLAPLFAAMVQIAALFLAVMTLALCTRPSRAHDLYTNWLQRSGSSCCNDHDCYDTRARYDAELKQWWALRREDQKWLLVPKVAYDPMQDQPGDHRAPQDGRAHMCAPNPAYVPGSVVYCFTPGLSI